MKRALFILLCLLIPAQSWAAVGEICGDGIDNDSSGGDALCSALDQDRDSYYSDGTGPLTGTDCDDTNRYIYPGVSVTSGCSAGNFRTCQADGTYTACAALSTFSKKSGSGVDYWIDDSVSTCAASNDYTHPSDWRCFSDTGMTNYHAPAAGDAFIFKSAGTYNTTWGSGTKHIYVSDKDGTSSDHITIAVLPGETWWERGIGSGVLLSGTNTGSNGVVTVTDSSYWDITGLEVTSASGAQTVGVWWNGGDHGHGWNLAAHGIRGTSTGNLSGLRANSHATWHLDHVLSYDNYDSGDPTGENNADILFMDVSDVNIHDFVSFSTTTPAGLGVKGKHVGTGTTAAYVQYGVVYNKYAFGIGIGGYSNITVSHNYLEQNNTANSGSSLGIISTGTTPVTNAYQNMVFEYNTIKNGPCFEVRPEDDATQLGSPFAVFRKNICIDNRGTSYPADGTDGFFRIAHYLSDAVYAELITGATLTIDHNCYYNSAGTAIFSTVFGDNASTSNGTTYSTCAAMIAGSGTIAHTSSVCTNPVLDADGRATDASCSAWGWRIVSTTTTSTSSSTSTSTTSTTSTTTSVAPGSGTQVSPPEQY